MRSLLRKLRGALGMGLTWAVVWALIFYAIGTVIGIVDPDSIDPGEEPIRISLIGGVFGLVSGVVFSTLLAAGDRNKKIRDLSLARAAIWGFLGTSVFPLISGADARMALIFGPIGAALAAGMVALAKRGEKQQLDQASELGAVPGRQDVDSGSTRST